LSITINPGEKVAIIGRIGSGKTTLERLIMGLYQPTAGHVRIDDTDIQQAAYRKTAICSLAPFAKTSP